MDLCRGVKRFPHEPAPQRIAFRALRSGATLIPLIALLECAEPRQGSVLWTAQLPSSIIQSDSSTYVVLSATILPGWHMYGLSNTADNARSIRITVRPPDDVTLLPAKALRQPDTSPSDSTSFIAGSYTTSLSILLPLKLHTSTLRTIQLDVSYVACTDSYCGLRQRALVKVHIRKSRS